MEKATYPADTTALPNHCEYLRTYETLCIERGNEEKYRTDICVLRRCEYPNKKCGFKAIYNHVNPNWLSQFIGRTP